MADEDLLPEGEDGGDTVVLDTEDVTEDTANQPVDVDIDGLAQQMGWTPKDQWRGDPEKWRPAPDYLRNTVDVNRGLVSKLDNVEKTVANMARTSAQLTEQAVAKERSRLMQERSEAFELGDGKKFTEIEQEISKLDQTVPQTTMSPEATAFAQRHEWFGKDQEATAWAVNRTNDLARQGLGHARQLSIVEREAKTMFPELFTEDTPAKPAPLNKPGARGGTAAKKGFSSLPADVQNAALEYERRKVCTREEYAKTYYEEEA